MSSSDAPAPVENAASVPDPSVPTSDPDPSDDPVDIEVDPALPFVDHDPVEPVPNDVNVPILVSVDVDASPHVDASPKVDVVPVGEPLASAEESVASESSGSSVKSKSKKRNVTRQKKWRSPFRKRAVNLRKRWHLLKFTGVNESENPRFSSCFAVGELEYSFHYPVVFHYGEQRKTHVYWNLPVG